jgi:hypothetical protein
MVLQIISSKAISTKLFKKTKFQNLSTKTIMPQITNKIKLVK